MHVVICPSYMHALSMLLGTVSLDIMLQQLGFLLASVAKHVRSSAVAVEASKGSSIHHPPSSDCRKKIDRANFPVRQERQLESANGPLHALT